MAAPQEPSSSAAPPSYIYSRLPDARSIRILTLEPSDDASSPLTGTIEEALLDATASSFAPAVAPYETISYAWGTGSRDHALFVHDDNDNDNDDGHHRQPAALPLTASLHDALARVRLRDAPRRIWADQICINQDDLAERSQQVRLMNAIYRGAARILVWLGRDGEGVAEDAVRMVRDLDAVFRDEERHRAFKKAHSEELHLQRREPWMPLSKMTKLPWFHRIWIVQEIGTDAPATLFWGASELDWQVLSHVAGVLNQDYHHLRARFGIGTPNIRYLHRRFVEPGVVVAGGSNSGKGNSSSSSSSSSYDEHHNRGSFVYELHRARHMLARDPRDHVYAFLGHFSVRKGSWALAGLQADYARPVADVYVDVAVRVLKGATSLILLSANHNADGPQRRTPFDQTDLRLPSWVPDWRVLPVHMIGSPQTPHRAARDTLPQLVVDEEKRLLHARGFRVDTIAKRSWVFYGKAFQFKQANSYSNSVDVLWREYCGYDTFNLDDRYPGGAGAETEDDNDDGGFEASSFFALIQTLTNACIGVDRSRPYASIPSRRWLAGGAAYLSRSGIPPQRISPAIRAAARADAATGRPAGDAFKWSHEATLVTRYRRFGVTAGGRYVMGPDAMREGDVVAVLYGGRTPFVLRKVEEGYDGEGGGWSLVGECYVHGIMNGEALRDADLEEEVFATR